MYCFVMRIIKFRTSVLQPKMTYGGGSVKRSPTKYRSALLAPQECWNVLIVN